MNHPPPVPPPPAAGPICPRCGQPMPTGAPHCPRCGNPGPNGRPHNYMPPWKIILIVLSIIFALGLLAFGACVLLITSSGL